jgi:hypothetical protein
MPWHPRASPASSNSPMIPGRPALAGRPGDADFVHDPVLRYIKTYGLSHEQLAMVSVVQREWRQRTLVSAA